MYLLKIFKIKFAFLIVVSLANAAESEKYPITLNDWSFIVEKIESKNGVVENPSMNGWILKSNINREKPSIQYGFVYGNPFRIANAKSYYSASTKSKLMGFRNRTRFKNMNSKGLIESTFLDYLAGITDLEIGPSQEFAKTIAMSALLKKLAITPDEFLEKNQFLDTKPYIEDLMKVGTVAPPHEIKIPSQILIKFDDVGFNVSGYFRIAHNVQKNYAIDYLPEADQNYEQKIKNNYNRLCIQKNSQNVFIQDFCKRIDYDAALTQAIDKHDYSKLEKIILDKDFINSNNSIDQIYRKAYEIKDIHLLNFLVDSNLLNGAQLSNLKSISKLALRYKHMDSAAMQTEFKNYYDGLVRFTKIKQPEGIPRQIIRSSGDDANNPWCKLPKPDLTKTFKFEIPVGWQKIDYNILSFYLPEDFEKEYPTNEQSGMYSHEYVSDDGTKLVPQLRQHQVASSEFIKSAKKILVEGKEALIGTSPYGKGSMYGGILFSKTALSSISYKYSNSELGLMMSSENKCFENLVFQISKTIQFKNEKPQLISKSKQTPDWQKFTLKNCCTFSVPKDFKLQKPSARLNDDFPRVKSELLYFKTKTDDTYFSMHSSNQRKLNEIYSLESIDYIIDQRKAECISYDVTKKFSGCYFQSIRLDNNILQDSLYQPNMLAIELSGNSKNNSDIFKNIIGTIQFVK